MNYYSYKKKNSILLNLLGFNIILFLVLVVSIYWVNFLKSSILEYSNIESDSFNGTSLPITFIPNWLNPKNTNKSMEFSSDSLGIDEFIELPKYDTNLLLDDSWKNNEALLARYTYPVVYAWNYKLDYKEYEGSHPWIDIRAPIWTPVLSIANWVVVKTKNIETWDGKYVIIRHDNIIINWITETIYSSYLHLSDVFVDAWTKINVGEVLGKVWITWITTTPHLHFQIDKKSAPFHTYWPFSFKDAADLWMDFFSAVNKKLGNENVVAYTINPMEFVQNNLRDNWIYNSAPIIDIVSAEEIKPVMANNETTVEEPVIKEVVEPIKNEVIVEPTKEVTPEIIKIVEKPTPIENIVIPKTEEIKIVEKQPVVNNIISNNDIVFRDIPKTSKLFNPTKFLYEKWITKGYADWTFKPTNQLSRSEALIFIFKLYNIPLDSNRLMPFNDIPNKSFIIPYLQKSLDLGLISRNPSFRPNDTISRAEFVTILIKASWKTVFNNWNSWFIDVKYTDWYSPYVETFAKLFVTDSKSRRFEPNSTFNRSQIAQILYTFVKK